MRTEKTDSDPPGNPRGSGFVRSLRILLIVACATAVVGCEFERPPPLDPPPKYEAPNLEDYASEPIDEGSVYESGTVYVPIYSHVYYDRGQPYSLEATLSIRNTDLRSPLYIRSVRYYDSDGTLIRDEVDRLIRLGPLGTIDFVVGSRDSTGGSGANFIVEWLATERIDPPLIEAVMAAGRGRHAIAFRAPGRTLSVSAE